MLWTKIKNEVKEWKYHICGILSFLIKYIVPLVYVYAKAMTKEETRNSLSVWGILVIIVLVLIYYGILRKALTSGKAEENIVKRLNANAVKPLRLIFFTFLDDVIVMPLIPVILWQVCDMLQKLAVNISLAFLAVTIMFVIGGILKLVDVIIDLNRLYAKEGA